MEIITFESSAYKDLAGKIDRIAEYIVKKDSSAVNPKDEVWLDSAEVANMLKISTKTLQRLRKDRLIAYTMLRGRCLYRLSDIEKGLNERIIKGNPETLDDFYQQYLLENGAK